MNPFHRSRPSLRRQSTREMLQSIDALMERLRAAREDLQIEADEMASKLGTNEERLLSYESGTAFPGLDLVVAYAGVVGVHIDISTQDRQEWRDNKENQGDAFDRNKIERFIMSRASHSGPRNWLSNRGAVIDGHR